MFSSPLLNTYSYIAGGIALWSLTTYYIDCLGLSDKSILRVVIFLLIDTVDFMSPKAQNIIYIYIYIQQISLYVQIPAMADQRKAPEYHLQCNNIPNTCQL